MQCSEPENSYIGFFEIFWHLCPDIQGLAVFILKFFRSLVADEEQFAGSKVNIRQGVLENVAAALDPAFPELAEQTEEHRSIFQVCI